MNAVSTATPTATAATAPPGLAVETEALTVRYGSTVAVDRVSVAVAPGTIVGLLGRNGAGKSTLLRTVAAQRRPTSGLVRVDGEDPYEHRRLMSEICLVRDDGDLNGDVSIRDTVSIAACLRPRWDQDQLERLADGFEVPIGRRKVGALSRGQRSALAISIGLATQAPLTLFDEAHLGMDAPSRQRFYDELLAAYLDQPRTIVVSTHLIDEMASLFEDVMILDHGAVLTHQPADDLRASGVELTGPTAAVAEITTGMSVLSTRTLGPTTSAVVFGHFNGGLRAQADGAGVTLGPIPLQDLFIALTDQEAGR